MKNKTNGKMTKREFLSQYADKVGCSKKEAKKQMETFFFLIADFLKKDDAKFIEFTGYGRFKKRKSIARKGTHPSTQKTIDVKESQYIVWKSGKWLKERMKNK